MRYSTVKGHEPEDRMSWGIIRTMALLAALFALAWAVPDRAVGETHGESAAELTEAQRRTIFREVGQALIRAEKEAESKYRDDPQSMARVHYEENLSEEYKKEIAAKHGISYRQLVLIGVEGFRNHWHVVVK